MTATIEVRDFILDFLRKELVGPSPLPDQQQENGEEILRPQDPPRQRYGAGILFPQQSMVNNHEMTEEDEQAEYEASSPESDGILDRPVDDRPQEPSESVSETDLDVNLANQYFPSAMGLSVLLEVPEQLRIEVSAATYVQQDPQPVGGKGRSGRPWLRQPIKGKVHFDSSELLGDGRISLEKPIQWVSGVPSLVLHLISRPYGPLQTTRLVTLSLVNRIQSESQAPKNVECFFQCGFRVAAAGQEHCFIDYPDRPTESTDPEEHSLQLLYSHKRTFAVGHGCAAEWNDEQEGRTSAVWTEVMPTFEVKPIEHTSLPGLHLGMAALAHAAPDEMIRLCGALADYYEEWIEKTETEALPSLNLSAPLLERATKHLDDCRACLARIREGIELLGQDTTILSAFRMMNEAMLMQQIHYEISTRPRTWVSKSGSLEIDRPFQQPSYDDASRAWRPFQLAFILMNLKSIANPHSADRRIVDVIWFPTGGGKTEAYLGLSAFTMFLRRLRNPENGGTSILMRYTLRLLTTQQFQRAASLMCASEVIRRRASATLGSTPFSIGLWVGSDVSPNTEEDALTSLRRLQQGDDSNKFILLSCPWCGAAMGSQGSGQRKQVKGYKILPRPQRVRHRCEDSACEFSTGSGLPVAVIDEQIYKEPPTLLIGTVDKFAMLTFRPEARSIFGIDEAFDPPDLIIQDELHLIAGPLGSMVGHYETAIDALCRRELSGVEVGAKIVGSTATITRAESQVRSLYARPTALFPPQALRAGDSFFAEEREDREGRQYVGVFANALPSHVTSQVRTMGALLQAPMSSPIKEFTAVDPYWTLMGYFNSLRELGNAATLIRADIREYMNAMWDRLGLRLDVARQADRRFINRDVELTSRVQSSDIPSILQQLFVNYKEPASQDVIDICFATNMIQVGLDIPRLSLMTIVGQPKTTSEYIQASSRVGRTTESPGIIVTNYNPTRSRDRSVYEHFRSFHQRLYMHVEPATVTPFSVPVRERALHALIVILCRFWGGQNLRERPSIPPEDQLIQRIKGVIKERVMFIARDEWPATEKHIDEIFGKWAIAPRSLYGDFRPPTEELPMMYPAGGNEHPRWADRPYSTPSTMRSVDATCAARPLASGYGI